MAIDVEKLLAPISPAAPCGADLSYDPAYLDLERLAQGTPERQVGDVILVAEEPNWATVRQASLGLLGRAKDLRVVMSLALSLLRTDGVAGLREGLKLLRGMLDKYWDLFYPQLSPDDNLDPTERMNIIASLATEDPRSPLGFVRHLRETPLTKSRAGRFSLRDILISQGQWPASANEPAPDKSLIDAAFQDTPTDVLQATAQAVEDCLQETQGIEEVLNAKAGRGKAPSLSVLANVLKQMRRHLQDFLGRRGLGSAAGEAAGSDGGPAVATATSAPGEIASPQDVLRVLENVCRYYQKHEPSSPVPLLVRRAQRLVSKSFIDIVRDLTPDAITQIQLIGGSDATSLGDKAPPPQ